MGMAIRECDCQPTPQELAGFALRMVVERMRFRIDVMKERGLDGVSISKGFAQQIVRACQHGSALLEDPRLAQAGLAADSGNGSANVSEGVTGGGERAASDAAGEIGGPMKSLPVDDSAAPALCAIAGPSLLRPAEKMKPAPAVMTDQTCDDCPPLGYPTNKTRCAPCPRLDAACMAGIASNLPCRPDDTLKRCTICGFVIDTHYAAEKPTTHLRPTKGDSDG